MGKTAGPEMFSGLTKQELQVLFAKLGGALDASTTATWVEVAEVRKDVDRALSDVVHAEFAPRRAQAEAEAAERQARAEAGDPEAYLDFF